MKLKSDVFDLFTAGRGLVTCALLVGAFSLWQRAPEASRIDSSPSQLTLESVNQPPNVFYFWPEHGASQSSDYADDTQESQLTISP